MTASPPPPRAITRAEALELRHFSALDAFARFEHAHGRAASFEAWVLVVGDRVAGPVTAAGADADTRAAFGVVQREAAASGPPPAAPPAVDPLAVPRLLYALAAFDPSHPLLAGQAAALGPMRELEGAIRALTAAAAARPPAKLRAALERLQGAADAVFGKVTP